MKNQHRPLTFLINLIKLTYLVKYFYTSILIKFVMSCTGFKPRKPIFKKKIEKSTFEIFRKIEKN